MILLANSSVKPSTFFSSALMVEYCCSSAWVLAFHKRKPAVSMSIREDLQLHHDRHQVSGEIAAAE